MSNPTSSSTPATRFWNRLYDWFKPAGVAGGAYLVTGATCPCCGGSVCPVGLGSSVAVGGVAAVVSRLWHFVGPNRVMSLNACHSSDSNDEESQ